MVDFLRSDDILVDVEIDGEVKRIPLWQKAQAAVLGKDYGFEENKIKVIAEKVNAQMDLTPEEAKLYKAFLTEVAAHETQYLLGTESFIDKVISTDRSFARKMIDRILNLKEAFAKVGDKATKAQLKMLRQAERLYLDAARKAGDMRLVKYILGRSPELEEEVESDAQIVYNRKKTARYIPYEKVDDDVVRHIKTELKKIYNNEDGVADGIAIEHGSDVYIVDSGRENGRTTFGIRRRKRISDARLRAKFIRSTNNDAVSKRFVSDEISSRVGNGLGGDSGRNMRREFGAELQVDSRKPEDNKNGVSVENEDNGGLRHIIVSDQGDVIRFNPTAYNESKNRQDAGFGLKDSEPTYTEEQYNSFGWASEAGGITFTELNDLYSKIQKRTTLHTFKQSSKSEAIIEVNKKPHATLDVDNVFVFVKGTKDNFRITRTVRFNVETETEMEILKEKLYERGTCSDTYLALYQKEGLAREYRREDSPTFAAYREGRSNRETSRGANQNNRGRTEYRSGHTRETERIGGSGNEFLKVVHTFTV